MDDKTLLECLQSLYDTGLFSNFFFRITWVNEDYSYKYPNCFDGYLKDFLALDCEILSRYKIPVRSCFRFYIQINSRSISCVYQEGLHV